MYCSKSSKGSPLSTRKKNQNTLILNSALNSAPWEVSPNSPGTLQVDCSDPSPGLGLCAHAQLTFPGLGGPLPPTSLSTHLSVHSALFWHQPWHQAALLGVSRGTWLRSTGLTIPLFILWAWLILPKGGPLESLGSLHFSAPSPRLVQEDSGFGGVVCRFF